MEDSATSTPTHIIFLVHGLYSRPSAVSYLASCLVNSQPDKIVTHCSKSNGGFFQTTEGIETLGKRLRDEVKDTIAKHPSVTQISFIGHSLGGLISRYCIGLLYEENFFEKCSPQFYISMATPHVGSRRPQRHWFNYAATWATTRFFGPTGRELMLEDNEKDPILVTMAKKESSYFKGLALFKERVAYANITMDWKVPYSTAAISHQNPYLHGKEISRSEKYPKLVEDNENDPIEEVVQDTENEDIYANDLKKQHLREILTNLRSLQWRRIGAYLDNSYYFAHELMLARSFFPSYADDVTRHIVDTINQ